MHYKAENKLSESRDSTIFRVNVGYFNDSALMLKLKIA